MFSCTKDVQKAEVSSLKDGENGSGAIARYLPHPEKTTLQDAGANSGSYLC
jgi:hypothetical protein